MDWRMAWSSAGDNRPSLSRSLEDSRTTAMGSDSGVAVSCCISAAVKRRTLSWLYIFFIGAALALLPTSAFLSSEPVFVGGADSDSVEDSDEALPSEGFLVESPSSEEVSSSDGMVGRVAVFGALNEADGSFGVCSGEGRAGRCFVIPFMPFVPFAPFVLLSSQR
jgi:hypothetical protein